MLGGGEKRCIWYIATKTYVRIVTSSPVLLQRIVPIILERSIRVDFLDEARTVEPTAVHLPNDKVTLGVAMKLVATREAELFPVDHVEVFVDLGRIRRRRRPRCRRSIGGFEVFIEILQQHTVLLALSNRDGIELHHALIEHLHAVNALLNGRVDEADCTIAIAVDAGRELFDETVFEREIAVSEDDHALLGARGGISGEAAIAKYHIALLHHHPSTDV